MFLIAITKDEISQNFQYVLLEEIKLHSFTITIVTDNFLSKFLPGDDGFSIIESPLLSSSDCMNIIFSQITYEKNNESFKISRSTISGRPIYYYLNSKGDFFCSTHISLLRQAGVPIEENTDVLPEFFVYRFVMPPNTLYDNIYQLFSGSQITIKLIDEKCKIFSIKNYIPPISKKNKNVVSISNNALFLLNESIQAANLRKNRMSILLSGGLDSSILCRICQEKFNVNTTFSTSYPFEDPQNNLEKEYSISAANLLKTKHSYFEMTTEYYLQGLLEAIYKSEVPVHHLQSVPIYLLFKKIPETKNIVISGLGADDLFGTDIQYNLFCFERNFIFRILTMYQKNIFFKYFSTLNKIMQKYTYALENYRRSTLPLSDTNNLIWSIGNYGSEEWVSNYFNITKETIINDRYNEIIKFKNRSIYDIISILLFLGSASVTQAIWSKLGECEKKILYNPYLNFDLINFAFSVPWDIKLKRRKNVLRLVAQRLEIPDTIINRPKSGFGIHSKRWATKDGVFEALIPLASKVFDEKEIRKMQSSESKKAMTYWNMLNYAIWKRLCIDNEPTEVLLEEL